MKQRFGLDAPFAYAASMNGLAVAANNHDDDDDDDDDDNDTSSPTSTIVPPLSAVSRRSSLVTNDLTSEKLTANTTIPDAAAVAATTAADDLDTAEETEEDTTSPSKLHPRVAVILGVDRKWYLPLVICRALSVVPALWWGLRCAFTFLAELLRIRPGMWREGWVAIIVGSASADWDVERRFRVTEVALAIMWVCISISLIKKTMRVCVCVLTRVVLCICVSFVFLHGLHDVSLVCLSQIYLCYFY